MTSTLTTKTISTGTTSTISIGAIGPASCLGADKQDKVIVGNIDPSTAAMLHTVIDGLTSDLDKVIAGKLIAGKAIARARAQATVPVAAAERRNSRPAVVAVALEQVIGPAVEEEQLIVRVEEAPVLDHPPGRLVAAALTEWVIAVHQVPITDRAAAASAAVAEITLGPAAAAAAAAWAAEDLAAVVAEAECAAAAAVAAVEDAAAEEDGGDEKAEGETTNETENKYYDFVETLPAHLLTC